MHQHLKTNSKKTTPACVFKKRAQRGDLAAPYQAYQGLLDLWSQNQANAALTRDFFDAALSAKLPSEQGVSDDVARYVSFKRLTLIPQLETYAHGQLLEANQFNQARELNKHPDGKHISPARRIALHRVRRLYELHFKHTQSAHSGKKIDEIKDRLLPRRNKNASLA